MTDKQARLFEQWLHKFSDTDLERLGKILWTYRQERYREQDKTILPYNNKRTYERRRAQKTK